MNSFSVGFLSLGLYYFLVQVFILSIKELSLLMILGGL